METPCNECNRIRNAIIENWINRHHSNLLSLYRQEREHKAVCPVVNGTWYLGLWTNAESVIVVEVEA